MKKQYKLIKTYPSSKPIGTIATETTYNNNRVYNVPSGGNQLMADEVENWPEYWQPVNEAKEKPLCPCVDDCYAIAHKNSKCRRLRGYNDWL
jgi:hypothetical protein